MKTLIIIILTSLALCAIGCIMSAKSIDLPWVGESNIAFTISDGYQYDSDYNQFSDFCTYDAGHRDAVIINPSPQKYRLKITNVRTGQVFTVQYRDKLKDDKYRIERVKPDGEIISKHELIINRYPNP